MADPRLDNPQAPEADGVPRASAHAQSPSWAGRVLAPPWWWGTRPGRLGVFTVILGAVLGAVITVAAGRDPGLVLGVFLVVATVIAAFVVRPRAAYLVIPVPALAYVAAALVAGLIHDRARDTTHTLLALSAIQWIASGFLAMVTATAVAVVVTAARWLLSRRPGSRASSGNS
jgi:hypothetical protein